MFIFPKWIAGTCDQVRNEQTVGMYIFAKCSTEMNRLSEEMKRLDERSEQSKANRTKRLTIFGISFLLLLILQNFLNLFFVNYFDQMTIITWNLWNKNPDQIGSIKNLINKEIDVICLQEVMLETVNYYQKFCLESQEKENIIPNIISNIAPNSVQKTVQNLESKNFSNPTNNSTNNYTKNSPNNSINNQNLVAENSKQNSEKNVENLEKEKNIFDQEFPQFSQNSQPQNSQNFINLDLSYSNFKKEKWQIFTALDHRDSKNQHYLVILTRLAVCHHFCDYLDQKPPKSFLAKRYKIQSIRQFQYVDLLQNQRKIRVFNTHLEIAIGPTRRLNQFENLVKHFGFENNIICGDFNIFPHPIGSFFVGWAASFSLGDYKINERKKFEILFKKLGLNNLFAKKITYPKYKLQLDHILTSNNLLIIDKKIEKKTAFSDHYQLYCQVKI